jgi:hypothetical protein
MNGFVCFQLDDPTTIDAQVRFQGMFLAKWLPAHLDPILIFAPDSGAIEVPPSNTIHQSMPGNLRTRKQSVT